MKNYTGRWLWIISPTYKIAEAKKKPLAEIKNRESLTNAITRYNHYYLFMSALLAITFGIIFGANRHTLESFAHLRNYSATIIGYLIISRAVEIFTSFFIDAIEKLNGKAAASNLKFGDRLHLALNSYLELMIGFGLLYYLLPDSYFSHPFASIIESIYFSAVTMTTVGYGDFSPHHWMAQLLVILQIFCGLTLALVCFTVYTTLALSEHSNKAKE